MAWGEELVERLAHAAHEKWRQDGIKSGMNPMQWDDMDDLDKREKFRQARHMLAVIDVAGFQLMDKDAL